ncbi:MAG TPA: ABC transporter substrate-binding protein [Ktedonobacteraceae bacterium]|jgi:NitT/TauT family transport system substrate-binding protein
MAKRYEQFALFLVLIVLLTTACGSAATANSSSSSSGPSSFTIAYQPGLSSLTLVILKQQKTLEKQFPQTNFQWKVVNSGASVRDAMIANQAQLGSLGLPPFLVGWDHGFDWKVLAATNRADIWLVTKDPRLKSLKDFTPNDKIGVVAPDSQQAILLRKAAQDQLGNAHALDHNLVSIASADGEQALLDGQLAAHYSGAPFQNREVAAGGHIILHSSDAFGPVGAGLVVQRESLYNQYPDFSKKLYQDINAATAYAKTHHDQTAQYLSQDQGGGGTPTQFKALLDDPSFVFDTIPSGLVSYATFMKSIGLISKAPGSVKDLELPTVYGIGN